MKTPKTKIIDRIQKLLALSSSPNEHESALALSKAHELMSSYDLSLSQVEIQENPILQRPISFGNDSNNGNRSIPIWIRFISHDTAKSFNCNSYTNRNNIIFFVGTIVDTQVAEYIFQYLINAVSNMAENHIKQLKTNKTWHTILKKRQYKSNYIDGIVQTICAKLRDYVEKHHPKGEGLIHMKSAKLDEYYSNLKKKLGLSTRSVSVSGGYGFASGISDGKSISINPGLRPAALKTKFLK